MDFDLMIPSATMLALFILILVAALIALSITESSEISKLAIENRCEFNHQTDVWEHCKGPITPEIK